MKLRDHQCSQTESGLEHLPEIGGRIMGKSTSPDERMVRDWIGPEAFEHWVQLRSWIDRSYPGVFDPEWRYRGGKRGWILRYKKTKAFCTLLPGYKLLSVEVVLGRAEREKFEERRYFWRPQLIKLYDNARTYTDGKWLAIEVSSEEDRREVMDLVSMKRPPLACG